jgi:nucleotide-binding universal stress UspA family protein
MSEIRSILLHADATAGCGIRLEIARELAGRLGAELTALFGAAPQLEGRSFGYSAGAALADAATNAEALVHEQARNRLLAIAGNGRAPTQWFDVTGDSITHGFLEEAAYADLLVIGRQDDDEPGGPPHGFGESVILDSGKPTLVVPQEPAGDSVGECALVAWNGSPQAARALAGALPLLRRANRVHVATWSRQPVAAPFSRTSVSAYLHRQGVDATLHAHASVSNVGQALMHLAAELRADLVVMGCYGRSRTAERMLGGASRSVLSTMPVATLMSH